MRDEARVSGWIALMFALTAAAWCITIPVGEAPDEREHLQYAQFVREHGRLPAAEDLKPEAIPEAFQAPLYHTILAGLSAAIGFDPGRIAWIRNPLFDRTSVPGRANEFDHEAVRDLNSKSDLRNFRIMRLPNVLFGSLLIWIVLRTMSALGAFGCGGLLAVIAASTPLLTFTAGSIGNDMFAALFCAVGVFALVRARVRSEPKWMWLTGLAFALNLLIKMNVLFLWLAVLVFTFLTAPRWKLTRDRLILTLVPLPSALWIVNRTLQLQERSQAAGGLMSYVVTGVKTIYHCASTSVGVVGVHSIWLPGFVYGLFFAIAAVVLYRWLRLAKLSDPVQRISLAGWLALALMFLAAVYWYRDSGFAMHSRLFLPYVPAMLLDPALAWRNAISIPEDRRWHFGWVITGIVLLAVSFAPNSIWAGIAESVRLSLSLAKPAEHFAAMVSLLLSALGTFLIGLTVADRFLPRVTAIMERKPRALLWFAAAGFGANLLILFVHVRPFFS